jgi:uncharacterized protein YkwD
MPQLARPALWSTIVLVIALAALIPRLSSAHQPDRSLREKGRPVARFVDTTPLPTPLPSPEPPSLPTSPEPPLLLPTSPEPPPLAPPLSFLVPAPDLAPAVPPLAPEALRIAELVNAERAAAGLAPLALSAELSAAAQAQSDAMAFTGVISHVGADGRGPAQRISDAGYGWLRCGENIAVGQTTPEEAMAFWMGSTPHRANILDPGMRELGVGYLWVDGGYGHYWTITLGER